MLFRSESIIFPSALQVPKQTEIAPLAPQPVNEAPPQHPPTTDQPEQGKEKETQKGLSSNKVTEASQSRTASQDFEKQLALVILSVQESLKGKEKEIPPKVADQAPKPKLQLKLKP